MVLSFDSRKSKGATNAELLLHSLKRSAIIFALGVFLYAYPRFNVHTTRIPGVLQRIAIVYLVTSPLVLYAGRATRSIVAAAILLGYWMLMVLVPVPGYGAGVLTMDGSLATYVDRALLYNHLEIAHRFDPEGILSTLPALATCLFGVMAGQWIQRKHGSQLIRALLAGAVVGVSVGYGWSAWFPLNKKLWTSSYVCFTAGLAMATLALCYWIIDVCGWRKWAQPFVWFGVNPLAIYFLASFMWEVISYPSIRGIRLKEMVYQHFYVNLFTSPYVNSAFYAVSYVCLFVIIAWLMYRRNIFIKV
jgi:predicted acyltransferase